MRQKVIKNSPCEAISIMQWEIMSLVPDGLIIEDEFLMFEKSRMETDMQRKLSAILWRMSMCMSFLYTRCSSLNVVWHHSDFDDVGSIKLSFSCFYCRKLLSNLERYRREKLYKAEHNLTSCAT